MSAPDNTVEKVAAWMIKRGVATGHGDNIDDLLSELAWQIDAALESAHLAGQRSQWMPIETAPRDGRVILVYGLGTLYDRYGVIRGHEFVRATHWQPLPPPPSLPAPEQSPGETGGEG